MESFFALQRVIVILVLVLVCIKVKPLQEPQVSPRCFGDTQPETSSTWVAAKDNSACNDRYIYTYHLKDENLSANQTVWTKEYLKWFKMLIPSMQVISSTEGLEPEGRNLLRHSHMIGYMRAFISSYFAVSLVVIYLHQKKSFCLKLKQFDSENRDVEAENQDERDSENWPLSPPSEMEVGMKNLQKQTKLGEKWEKNSSFLYAFGKRTFDHFFYFRRDQSFTQKCTVCPASVSLASHFASGTYGQPGSSQQLQKEGVRLASFKDFPTSVHVSAVRLAQAGFFYTGERDMVRCFSCGVTHDGWQMGDRPTLVHARISPNCPLVRGSDTANLPLPLPVTNRPNFPEPGSIDSGYGSHSYGSSGVPSVSVSSGSASYRGEEMQSDAAPDAVTDSLSGPPGLDATSSSATTSSMVSAAAANGPIASSLATPENSMFSGAPLFGTATPMDGGAPRNLPMPTKRLDLGGAVYPLYSQMDARKRSFSNWVEDQGLPSVDELITLGFFYAGYADCVRCFFCGIGLKSWEPGDIPAEVHARWRPTCEYLRLVKGDEFVDQVANGGRNVQARSGAGSGQGGHQPALIQAPSRDAPPAQQGNGGSSSPSNSSSQQGSAPPAVEVPDIPVVRRARETGYTDQQIAESIQKLRLIGMERAIEVMLVEVLINLFRDNPPQPQPQRQQQQDNVGNNDGNNAGDGNVARPDAAEPGNNADLQRDGAEHDDAVPDNAAHNGADDPLRERQNVLQQENARLRNMRTCQRCHEQPVGVIFLPCGHIIACTTCAPNIRRCLRCDTVIRATANVYFS